MKTPITFAVYTACLFRVVNAAQEMTSNPSSSYFISVHFGESVTLPCVCQNKGMMIFYWYKKTLGQTSDLMSTFYRHANVTFHDPFKDSRFSLDTKDLKYHLTISEFGPSDLATYFCIGSTFNLFEFCTVITVNAKNFDLDIRANVYQSVSEHTRPGHNSFQTCTINAATCDGEHSVYWFRNSEEAHPGLIYTHGGRNDQCERELHVQTPTCVYNLPLRSLTSAQDGTDHSAVVSCAHILLGDGTKPDLKDSHVLLFILASVLAATVLLIILSAFSLYKMKHRCCWCTADSSPGTTLCRDTDDLQYAALSVHRANGSRRLKDEDTDDSVYSCVRQ
ncbi:uncharacterized protein LOC121504602 [Cheilinus undulatus]|uniref:uncharacterized protein LOC121504602 n=1 Tax=Cheilinus undulatus TaxID=241271 RepID=UPI001BD5D696|nr:uncharacterized protein LOC121504602 [Cheilinus undulatus]